MIESGERLGRRTFLKIGTAALIGAGYEYITGPFKQRLDKDVANLTDHPSGSAREAVGQRNPQDLAAQSIFEEVVFRAAPATYVSLRDGKNPIKDVAIGDGKITMRRREALVGLGSAVLYAGFNNLTKINVGDRIDADTNTIPASPTVQGFGLWYLQRKFGFVSNLAANMFHKFKVFQA